MYDGEDMAWSPALSDWPVQDHTQVNRRGAVAEWGGSGHALARPFVFDVHCNQNMLPISEQTQQAVINPVLGLVLPASVSGVQRLSCEMS
jgi:hypothetical protein